MYNNSMDLLMKLHIRGATNGTTTGTFSISSSNYVINFYDFTGTSANFIVVPVGTELRINKIVASGVTSTQSMTVNVEVADDANNVSPTFIPIASYNIVTPSNIGVVDIDLERPLIIKPKASYNNNGVLSTTAIRFTWNQGTAFVAYIDVDICIYRQ